MPDPEVPERPVRRRFTAEYKLRIVEQANAATEPGAVGALLRREGLMGRVRRRIGDQRVLGLVRAFLGAGVLSEDGAIRETITGTPQGGILSPLLANIALSVLDEHFARKWEALVPAWTRAKRRRSGTPAVRLVRHADDFVVMVGGTRDDADLHEAGDCTYFHDAFGIGWRMPRNGGLC